MPADAVREAVKAEIRAVTGLDPVLRGGASVSLFPTGTVQLRRREPRRQPHRRAGAHGRARGRAAAFFSVPDRPHRDRRRLAGAPDHRDRLQRRPQLELVGPHRNAGAQPASRAPGATASFSEIRIEDGTVILRDEAYKIVETLSNVELALAWPSISQELRAPPGASPGTTSRSTPPSASPTSSPRCRATAPGSRSALAGAPFKFAFDGYHQPPADAQDGRHARGRRRVAARDAALGRPAAAAGRRVRPLRAQGADQRGRRHHRAVRRQCRARRQCRRGRADLATTDGRRCKARSPPKGST